MFKKHYIGRHGFNTFVQGVWVIDGDEYYVRVTRVGNDEDEFVPGEVYSLHEVADMTGGDPYSYAQRAAACLVA